MPSRLLDEFGHAVSEIASLSTMSNLGLELRKVLVHSQPQIVLSFHNTRRQHFPTFCDSRSSPRRVCTRWSQYPARFRQQGSRWLADSRACSQDYVKLLIEEGRRDKTDSCSYGIWPIHSYCFRPMCPAEGTQRRDHQEREYQNVSTFAQSVEQKDRSRVFSAWLEMVKAAERDYTNKNGCYGNLATLHKAHLLGSLVFESGSSAAPKGKSQDNFVPKERTRCFK